MKLWRKRQRNSPSVARTARQPQARADRVISYYTASKRQLDSFERKQASDDFVAKRHIRRLRKHWFVISMAVVAVLFLAAASSLGSSAYINVEPVAYRSADDYQRVIKEALQDDWRNLAKPLLQRENIEQQLALQLPESRVVSVQAPFLGRQAVVDITTDQPLAWFDSTGTSSLVLGERGKLLVPAEAIKNQDLFKRTALPSMRNTTGLQAGAGDQIMSPGEAAALKKLLFQFKQGEQRPPQLEYGSNLREIVVREPDREGYGIRFLLNEDIELQYGALRAVQKDLESRNIQPKEYIDVRLIDRVFYK